MRGIYLQGNESCKTHFQDMLKSYEHLDETISRAFKTQFRQMHDVFDIIIRWISNHSGKSLNLLVLLPNTQTLMC